MPPYSADDYEPVEDRIAKFWADHPDDGYITTELVDHNDKRFIVKARVGRSVNSEKYGLDQTVIATGLAEEVIGSGSPVNRNYALENCETSAIGRALANAGYATKGKRPSREEMQKVQRLKATPADDARADLRQLVHSMNLDGHKIADEYNHKYGDDLAETDSVNQIRAFTEFVRKREERDADPEATQG